MILITLRVNNDWFPMLSFINFAFVLSRFGFFFVSFRLFLSLSSFLKPNLFFFGSPGFYLSLWLYWTVALYIHSDSHGDGVPIFSYSFLKMNEKKSNHKYKALTHPFWWIYAVAESKIDWCLEAAMSLFIYCMHKSLEASWSFDTPIFVSFFFISHKTHIHNVPNYIQAHSFIRWELRY